MLAAALLEHVGGELGLIGEDNRLHLRFIGIQPPITVFPDHADRKANNHARGDTIADVEIHYRLLRGVALNLIAHIICINFFIVCGRVPEIVL
ncbi:hypothetical protein HMPREF2674_03350 [Rothia sp. HMSC062F03]|nr:hypothetical protein HMPREF2674_03350 [Rothia sp. HMSC062F03]